MSAHEEPLSVPAAARSAWVRRPRASAAATLCALALVLAACGTDDATTARREPPPSSSTTAAPPDTTTTTTLPVGDLAAASITLTPVADVTAPTAMAVRAGDPTLYVTEQAGRVRAVRDGRLLPDPVLDLRRSISAGGERGLLGITFSPDGSKLFVNFTGPSGDTRVEELVMLPDGTADPTSRRVLLEIDQPQPNHNGGAIAFGPDGLLYVGTGDGGAANDSGPGHAPGGNGQSLDTLLGKVLRIDPTPSATGAYTLPPDNPYAAGGGRPEIWSSGLRNPWRFSFDRATGDLWIGDVGQNQWEEIDFMPAGQGRGANYGWNVFEGTHRFRDGDAPGAVPPLFEYPHDGRCAVTGGSVYRGTRIPDLQGAYVYSDYCDGRIRALQQEGGVAARERDFDLRAGNVAAFGEDNDGELYVLSANEGLLRIDPA